MKSKISILILILLMSFCPYALGTDEVTYISDGDDDLFLTETGHLFTGTPLIEINEPLIGITAFFRFQDIDVPKDSIINNATLHLWTNNNFDPFDVLWATIYGIDEDDCTPFGDTSDLNSRPVTTAYVNWNISGVVGEVTEHTIEVTDIIKEITEQFNWVSGNDLGFKIVSAKGGPQRHVSAYEYSAMPEALLNVTYGEAPPQTPQDKANPPYNDPDNWNWTYWYNYRGYDIWNVTELGWVDYCTFNKIGTQPGRVTVVNCTYVDSHPTWEPDDNCRLEKSYTGTKTRVKFGVLFDTFFDTSPTAERYWLTLYGLKEFAGPQFDFTGDAISLTMWSDLTQNTMRYQLYVYDGAGYPIFVGGTISTFPTTHWIVFTYDESDKRYSVTIYTDKDMTTQWATKTDLGGWGNLDLYYQYGMNYADDFYNPHDEGHWSLYGKADLENYFFIHAPDCNLTDPDPYDPEEDDPEEIIDEILGPDPEDPEPDEWETSPISRFRLRLYFLIAGLSMFIGPLFFFAWRRPTGGQVVVGCLIMLIGISFLIHITQI